MCGQICRKIGDNTRLPSKRAVKQWDALRLLLQEQLVAGLEHRQRSRVRLVHKIEKEIARLQALPRNDGRSERIASLRKRLMEI
jgi:hypothetical protein